MIDAHLKRIDAEARLIARTTNRELKESQSQAGIDVFSGQSRSIKYKLLKKTGKTEGIQHNFPLHAAYVHYGAGPGDRKKKPWFEDPIDREIDVIMERITDLKAELVDFILKEEMKPESIIL